MHSQSGGTLTAICMLIPLVTVPYFAIRGTKDLDGQFPSLSGKDEIAFASTDGFEESSAEVTAGTSDAPPFPSDDSVVLDAGVGGGTEAGDWSNPFDKDEPGRSLGNQLQQSFEEFEDGLSTQLQPKSGLGGTQQRSGVAAVPRNVQTQAPAAPANPVRRVSGTKIRTQWQDLIGQLEAKGMRNYRVETVPDKSVYYVTAFFPNAQSGFTRRFEGEGPHPLTALRSVMQQVAGSQGGLAR